MLISNSCASNSASSNSRNHYHAELDLSIARLRSQRQMSPHLFICHSGFRLSLIRLRTMSMLQVQVDMK